MSRQDRVTAALEREISSIIHDELKDPRLGFVTLTKVELSKDLRFAKVFFSVLGKEQDYKNTQEALDSAKGFIKKLVCERIDLRFVPDIIFREDHSNEYSVKIEEILNQIKGEQDAVKKTSRRVKKK
ncbi:MAG: 30S ribosome-binding factor RbfA [Candidatus Omnitrophica bacterium]|nr:30S ribosome-binding factor RbfA [Candidatus Omnitrophota bacterium]